jgi:uncharacterized protein YciI
MTTLLPIILTIQAAVSWSASIPTAARGPQNEKMTTYYLVLLKKGAEWRAEQSAERQRIQDQHIAHLDKLRELGHGLAAGPFGDEGEIRGIVIMTADSAQHARELEEADPAVKAGRLAVEVLPFMAPEGWFRKTATPPQMETVYFGFLNSGPNRSQDAAAAQQLQKEHLAYMDAQAREGKLVLAGPFVEGGTRRGIVAYRVASLEEARTRAEADPMVKAGRLVVELHPWHVAKGVLP